MDVLKRTQRACKGGLLRVIREVETGLDVSPVDLPFIKNLMLQLRDMETKLKQADENVLAHMYVVEGIQDAEIETEMAGTRDVYIKVARVQTRVDLAGEAYQQANVVPPNGAAGTFERPENVEVNRNNHLPKIKLPSYNGEIGEWLSFWAQFENIHLDKSITDSNKFQYLKQAMVPGTKASRIVNQYPQTGANYPKVIKELKTRCGDAVLISEYYVRQLIKVLKRVHKGKEVSLAAIYDELESHLRCLESLGVSMESHGVILYPLVESSLPLETIEVWQRTSGSGYGDDGGEKTSNERLVALMKFLKQEVRGQERLELVKEDYQSSSSSHNIMKSRSKVRFEDDFRRKAPPTIAGLFSGEEMRCIFCNKANHESQHCYAAKKMTTEEKRAIIIQKRCCFSCLKPNHNANQCKSVIRCRICDQKHPTSMHNFETVNQDNGNLHKSSSPKPTGSVKNVNAGFAGSSSVYLGTFKTTLLNGNEKICVRGLYDPGANRSYISRATAELMKLQPIGTELINHTLFGGVQTQPETFNKYQVTLASKKGPVSIGVLDKEKICGSLSKLPRGPWMKELEANGIQVTDLNDDTPEEIELLIGANVHGKFLAGRVVQLSNNLTAQETILGWIVTGEMASKKPDGPTVAMSCTSLHVAEASIENLWSLESIGITDVAQTLSKEEREQVTKDNFMKTVLRKEDGRYSVRLPWISENPELPDNKEIAVKRLHRMTENLIKMGKFSDYEKIFKQWQEEDFIEEVKEDSVDEPSCYLPHRAVFKPSSLTTPTRPVFDASCKTKRSPSLNDCLEKGPNLLEQMPALLLRFREKRIGVTSDIRKAFQMVEVQQKDRNFLRFLWWEDYQKKKLKIYRHKRVVFGVNCSPFLLAAVIEVHLKSMEGSRKLVADQLLESFYVDNCVTSVNSLEEYEHFRDEATKIMSEAKMDLRVWQCSSREEPKVGSCISMECGLGTGGVAVPSGDSVLGTLTTVLGMNWDTVEDVMTCDANHSELPEKFTKRNVLSFIQQFFDPLGILCPVMLSPKKLMQEAWSSKTGWDEKLTNPQQASFKKWIEEAEQLQNVVIPRNFNGGNVSRESYQLHCFCDASQDAYASVVYLRTEGIQEISVQFLMAKSRISPMKKMTIPRLELMACTIGSRLTASVKKALRLENVPIFYWSDSSTALSWIQGNDEWGTFVGNRVKEILTLSKAEDWKHVPGKMNPADLPSRGCTPSQLVKSKWWEGPKWLRTIQEWPNQKYDVSQQEVEKERRKTSVVLLLNTETNLPWYAKFSSYTKNVRVLAWTLRYVKKIRKQATEKGPLTVMELDEAEQKIWLMVQKETFSKSENIISGLHVIRDAKGLICVKSKLMLTEDTSGFKMPILLPSIHPLVEFLIRETHKFHGHAGIQFVLGVLREKFWILKGRKSVRKVISSCVICRRFTANHPTTEVPPLPEDRVKLAKAFQTVGVDLAGPLYLKGKEKAWIVLFTCAVFRCIHLELVRSLSTEAFLDAFSRFMERRGRPMTVYSDNGTNFVGTVNLFNEINWAKVARTSSIERIQWKFNPPTAAWWGGWWERLVRSMKDLLRRILGTARVTYDKLHTYLISVEATLNGRPLTTLTEDPDDLRPLTPAMFLHELPSCSYQELDFITAPEMQQQLRDRKTILDEFQSRFRKEYLGQLMQRAGEKPQIGLKVGEVVLVGADHKKRWEWPLAKVVEIYPGRDGKVRTVKVKTSSGHLIRPIQRLYPLEVSSPENIPEGPRSFISVTKEDEKSSVLAKKITRVLQRVEKEKTEEKITRSGRKVKTPSRYAN